jgi:competence protein ComEC
MREPLLVPMFAIILGIIVGKQFDFNLPDALWPCAALALLTFGTSTKWLRRTTLGLCLLFAGVAVQAWHRPVQAPVLDAGPREIIAVEGCVVEPTAFAPDRAQFVLELAPGARAQVSIPRYKVDDQPPRLSYGQKVAVEGRFYLPRNFQNAGSFDYVGYLAHQGIYWNASIPTRGSVEVIPGRCGNLWQGAIYALRTAALDRIEALYPDNAYASAMMQAVLIGETAGLEKIWTEDFRRSGTYHALVISGIHVSVLAAVLLALLRLTTFSRTFCLGLTCAAAWIYALVSGFSMPVARAAAGFTLYLIASILFRRVRPLNFLAAVAIGLLLWDPQQLFEASFQLSFLSVAAIGAFAAPLLDRSFGPLARGLSHINTQSIDARIEPRAAQLRVELRLVAEAIHLWTRIPVAWAAVALSWLARVCFFATEMAVVSLAIQIGLALPMATYFHRLSFTGLTANLAVVPLMNLVVPLGFGALFTGWHWPAALADWCLRWSAELAAWHANLEPAWRVPDPPSWLAIALVASIFAAAFALRHQRLRLATMLATGILVTLLVASPWAVARQVGQLELTAIDVGQGDSLLLIFPNGKTMLIDGGGRLAYGPDRGNVRRRPRLDIGEDVVAPYLWSRGIRHIDVIAATHAHQDHIGGLRALIEDFQPSEFWTGANPPRELVDQALAQGTHVVEQRASAPFSFGGASVEVLAPVAEYGATEVDNNDSLVLRVTHGQRSFLLMGDLESAEEVQLLAQPELLRADVLKVGHHGSKTSTTPEFLDAVAPTIALISAGYDNTFGHPHPLVMERLEARHTTILRTDRLGRASVFTDGRTLRFALEHWQ